MSEKKKYRVNASAEITEERSVEQRSLGAPIYNSYCTDSDKK